MLGPLLFNLYTADISKVVEFHGHKVQYADDCQVYRSIPVSEAETAVNDFLRLRRFVSVVER